MKIFSIAPAVLLILCLLAYLIPISQTTHLTIMASFDNTVSQVMHPDNWKKWYPAGAAYHIDERTPLSYQVQTMTQGRPETFSFAVIPTASPDRTEIVVATRTRLLYRLLPFVHSANSGVAAINGLRSYLEDPRAFYGFPITIEKVTDTVYLTTQAVLSRQELFKKIPGLFSAIGRFIHDKDLRLAGNKAISYGPAQNDSLRVMAGVPVNRTVPGDDRINCVQMPRGRMLVGRYDGTFAGRRALYAGMQRYLSDHHLSLVADPYERYTGDRLPVSDSSTIHIGLYFPIR